MARICVDASAVLAWLLPDQRAGSVSRLWLHLLESGDELVGPPLLYAECTSVLREHAYQGTISADESVDLLRDLLALPILIVQDPELYLRAMSLATRLRHRRAYDAQYIAAAQLAEAEIVTLDGGLRQAAVEAGTSVRSLP